MDFRILGPLQVFDGDVEVSLGSPKERALLAVLLLHARTVVSRERLIDELWGESPPPTAAKALNVHVSQLRKALTRNARETVVTRPPGYALEIEPARLDAVRFEQLLAEAREQVAAGEVASARRLLGEALALWRGPALAGVELQAAARTEAGRLEELRLSAQLDRIDCELALGLHEQLVGELEALVAEQPLRERLRGQLILALYRSGRQADALSAYREARETLVGQLGIEPSAALQRLERAILNQDPSLEAPAGTARPELEPSAQLERRERAVLHQEPELEGPSGAASMRWRPRRRGRLLVALGGLALALAAAAAAIAALLAGTRGRAGRVVVPPDSVVAIDATTNKVVAAIPLSAKPTGIAVSDGAVWVGNYDDETLVRVDAKTRTVVRAIGLGGA